MGFRGGKVGIMENQLAIAMESGLTNIVIYRDVGSRGMV